MMKKKILHILSVLLVLVCVSAGAVMANEDTNRVYDYADLLTESEEAELTAASLLVEDDIETELYILTTNDAEGKQTVDYADDFGDEHAFGYDEPYGNYIVLCIDMDNRVVWVSTSGKAIEYLTEARIDSLIDDLYGYLTSGDYYNTCLSYIHSATDYLGSLPSYSEAETDPDRYQDTMYKYDEEPATSEMEILLFYLYIAMFIGAVAVGIMAFRSRSRMTANAKTYAKGSVRINGREDRYIRRVTTSRRIQTESHSSGSSGSHSRSGGRHTSSSGHSHGGGGRSF